MINPAAKLLAHWRRQGRGTWEITLVVEGHDKEFTHLLPGRLSKSFAIALAKQQCAKQLDEHVRFVILVKAKRVK